MFEVTVDGEIFEIETWDELESFFSEVINAVGAEDAEMSVKLK